MPKRTNYPTGFKTLYYTSKDPVHFLPFSRCRTGGKHHDSWMDRGFGNNCQECQSWNIWKDFCMKLFIDKNTGIPLDYPTDGYIGHNGNNFIEIKHDELELNPEYTDSIIDKEIFMDRFNKEFFEKFWVMPDEPVAEESVDNSNIQHFSQDLIKLKLDSGIEWLDAAFKILGLDPSDTIGPKTEGPQSRFYRYVAGDFKGEYRSYPAKSLSHPNARYCFGRFIKGTKYNSHIELAKDIALQNWEKLEELVSPSFVPETLVKNDNVGITGESIEQITEKAILVTGYGWLPRSKVKFSKGKMWIPTWLANKAKEAKKES